MLLDQAFPGDGPMDVAVSHAILANVARGRLDEAFRLFVPGRVVAFGLADRASPGYGRAVRAAQGHGFTAIERLAGGRAAVFHGGTLAFSWAVREADPRRGVMERFEMISSIMVESFRSLGVNARVGELPGEYCPGRWSVNVEGRAKVMGVGQRLVRGAAHVGGVVVVDDGRLIRDVLVPVYRALGVDWDPRTAGALADRSPGLVPPVVHRAIVSRLAEQLPIEPAELPQSMVEEARTLLPGHLPRVA